MKVKVTNWNTISRRKHFYLWLTEACYARSKQWRSFITVVTHCRWQKICLENDQSDLTNVQIIELITEHKFDEWESIQYLKRHDQCMPKNCFVWTWGVPTLMLVSGCSSCKKKLVLASQERHEGLNWTLTSLDAKYKPETLEGNRGVFAWGVLDRSFDPVDFAFNSLNIAHLSIILINPY